MNLLFKAGLEIQNFMLSNHWSFSFIGGLAVIRWGEVRMTQDIDITLFTGFGNEGKYIDKILSIYSSRIENPKNFALNHRTILIYTADKVPVDISMGGLSFEENLIKNSTYFKFNPDCSLLTCSADDLIILKAFANREIDWFDIKGIVTRQKGKLDFSYIVDNLKPLCQVKEKPEIIDVLLNIKEDYY